MGIGEKKDGRQGGVDLGLEDDAGDDDDDDALESVGDRVGDGRNLGESHEGNLVVLLSDEWQSSGNDGEGKDWNKASDERGERGREDDSSLGGEDKKEGNVKERGRKESCIGVVRVLISVSKRGGKRWEIGERGRDGVFTR